MTFFNELSSGAQLTVFLIGLCVVAPWLCFGLHWYACWCLSIMERLSKRWDKS